MSHLALVLALCAPQDNALARAKETACANNLRQLWALQMVYMSQFGGRAKAMPADTGREFWLALTKTNPPLVDETEMEVFVCPFSAEKPRKGFTTYRGPAARVNTLKATDVVGACVGLHPNKRIAVLVKSGDVLLVTPEEELHGLAIKGTLYVPPPDAKAQQAACRVLLTGLSVALTIYEIDFAAYPPSGNTALVVKLREKGPKKQPYFEFAKDQLNEKGEIVDPWGKPFVYVNNTDKSAPAGWTPKNKVSYDLYSFGPNGKDENGGGDDLSP